MTVSIVTPWRDAPELIPDYERATAGAQLVIVDHGSQPNNARQLAQLCARNGGFYIRDDGPWNFARLNNRGLARAIGEVVLFLNNDISAAGAWLDQAERDCQLGAGLCGPSLLTRQAAGRTLLYLEGWAIGAARRVWDVLGGWDDAYQGGYWEDNDLCFRAVAAGYTLRRTSWALQHKSNYTSAATTYAYDHSAANQARFEEMVANAPA